MDVDLEKEGKRQVFLAEGEPLGQYSKWVCVQGVCGGDALGERHPPTGHAWLWQ